MTFEEYKKKVEEYLIQHNRLTRHETKELIKECIKDIKWFFQKGASYIETANIITNPLF